MTFCDVRLGALGFALLMIIVALLSRVGIIENGDLLLMLMPALFVTTILAARDRRAPCGGR